MPSKVWDEITYPFSNFNGAIVEVCEWMNYFNPCFIMACNYLTILGLKLHHVSKKAPGNRDMQHYLARAVQRTVSHDWQCSAVSGHRYTTQSRLSRREQAAGISVLIATWNFILSRGLLAATKAPHAEITVTLETQYIGGKNVVVVSHLSPMGVPQCYQLEVAHIITGGLELLTGGLHTGALQLLHGGLEIITGG